MKTYLNDAIVQGAWAFWHRLPSDMSAIRNARRTWSKVRATYNLGEAPSPLLTPPAANMKLEKAATPTYGLTLQHHRVTLASGKTRNLCPWAGDCTKVCVLDNGNGAYPTVQRARIAKTHLFYHHPIQFGLLVGWELAKAVDDNRANGIDHILLRPNVNSDLRWDLLAPDLMNGDLFHEHLTSYGYTKGEYVLETDGWVAPKYRVAYSANERSDWDKVHAFLDNGGCVAVVTNRAKGQPVRLGCQWSLRDADKTDEWMFEPSVFGDLTAKGKARKLIGKSDFIQMWY